MDAEAWMREELARLKFMDVLQSLTHLNEGMASMEWERAKKEEDRPIKWPCSAAASVWIARYR